MTTAQELREEGRQETRIEMILNMYKNDFSLKQIALATKETVDSIVAILNGHGYKVK